MAGGDIKNMVGEYIDIIENKLKDDGFISWFWYRRKIDGYELVIERNFGYYIVEVLSGNDKLGSVEVDVDGNIRGCQNIEDVVYVVGLILADEMSV